MILGQKIVNVFVRYGEKDRKHLQFLSKNVLSNIVDATSYIMEAYNNGYNECPCRT